MKRPLLCLLLCLPLSGCSLFGSTTTYGNSNAYGEAHPDQAQPMPYMDPDQAYTNPARQ